MTVPLLEMRDVQRSFGTDVVVRALRGVELGASAGELVAIVGPSGSGKSTLLHLLGLLDRPSSGSYRVSGRSTEGLSERERAALRGSLFGFVFQSFHLLPHRSAVENVMLGSLYQGRAAAERHDEALARLATVGLEGRADTQPRLLSGGEQQRVAIARALMGQASVLLCDEPTGNLDRANSDMVIDGLRGLAEEGVCVVVVTHDDVVASRMQRVIELADGVVVTAP